MMENIKQTKRTILYYPTISIPTSTWLRQSLLYWDEISSIVPQSLRGHRALIPYSEDIKYLESVGQFRPISPDKLAGPDTWRLAGDLEKEMQTILQSTGFQNILPPPNQRSFESRIHRDKITDAMLDYFLEGMHLARLDNKRDEWIHVESNTALLYMALLAKYLALDDAEATVPGTDHPNYENWIFKAKSRNKSIACLSTRMHGILPIPRDDVPLADIVEFKDRRRSELLHFREFLDEFHNNLGSCQSVSDINQVVVVFGEKLERGVHDLTSILQDAKIATIWGAFKTLIQPNSLALWATIGSAIAAKITSIPLTWALPLVGIPATIEVGSYLADERNKANNIIKDSPFSYVYSTIEEDLSLPFDTDEEPADSDDSETVRPVPKPHTFA
ncbi:MAG: DUF6236 family protein [Chloroflexota bacterium]